MTAPATSPTPLPWAGSPRDLLAAWPAHVPLAALVSDDPDAVTDPGRRSRWTLFARADGKRLTIPASASSARACEVLAGVLDTPTPAPPKAPPTADEPRFLGGWLAALGYELGFSLEPASARVCERDPPLPQHLRRSPQAIFLRCDAAYAHDALTGKWWAVGSEDAVRRLPRLPEPGEAPEPLARTGIGRISSRSGQARYESSVSSAVRAIEEGEVFQANLAHVLRAPFEGDPRALFRRLLDAARPAFGAYIEWPSRQRLGCLLSASPELFLSVEPDQRGRAIVTRPIKGTRKALPGAAADLLHSRKDEAELAMITDLMRNDLGRVCTPGSVRVDDARGLERCADGDVLHTASTVSGRLRETVSNLEMLRATFPPGSVTGAPKVRAMQMIRALEPGPRGFYCGAIGFFSDSGHIALSVAIRTGTLSGRRAGPSRVRARVQFPVGAGIVAESDPGSEWRESLAKASVFRSLRNDAASKAPTHG